MLERISYVKPSITEREIGMATAAATFGWGANSNLYIDDFEIAFAKKIGVSHAIATSSCTGALHLGLKAANIGPGDEVILADTNWVATLAPLSYLGAKPVFVDISKDSWCIDPERVLENISSKTKAIIATHLYGNLCNMDHLVAIAKKHNLLLIEDAAEAIGSIYKGKHAGTIADFGVFSFHGSKTLTTGEGGMFVTNNKDLAEKVIVLNSHGRSAGEKRQFWPSVIGFKYKMTNMQAAIGLAQVERFDELVSRKQSILAYYRNSFTSDEGVRLNAEQPGCQSGSWMPNAVFDLETGITRELLMEEFEKENIDARVFFWPLSELGFYEWSPNTPISKDLASRSINLPSYHDMSDADQDRVIKVVKGVLSDSRRRRG